MTESMYEVIGDEVTLIFGIFIVLFIFVTIFKQYPPDANTSMQIVTLMGVACCVIRLAKRP